MSSFLTTLVLLAGLTQASSGVYGQATGPQAGVRREVAISSQPPTSTNASVITSGDIVFTDALLPEQARQTVLVVPAPDLPAESLPELTDDLTVMCRIFDKTLPSKRSGMGFVYKTGGDALGYYPFAQQGPSAQGLYLPGYGVLFFVHVDFPLLPTEPQEAPPAKANEATDTVWSQTIQEMTGQQSQGEQGARNAPAYDPQQVDDLKKTLVQILLHASNIRLRGPQESITVVVSALDDSRATRFGRYRSTGVTLPATKPPRPEAARVPPAAGLLVLRATKADVDAFAKGQSTAPQFTEKVQILFSPAAAKASAAPAVPPTPAAARR